MRQNWQNVGGHLGTIRKLQQSHFLHWRAVWLSLASPKSPGNEERVRTYIHPGDSTGLRLGCRRGHRVEAAHSLFSSAVLPFLQLYQ